MHRVREAVIVSAVRTPVGRAKKGSLAEMRAEDMGAAVLRGALSRISSLGWEEVEDVILGCAMPEAEQGMNVARIVSLHAGLPAAVPAMTINRFCASGLQAIANAAERIQLGTAEVIAAGGLETMSRVPMTGFKFSPHPDIVADNPGIYMAMGHTAERVAERYGISREDQDLFAYESHHKAAHAIREGWFNDEVIPLAVQRTEWIAGKPQRNTSLFTMDEGVRENTTLQALSGLKPAFKARGTVTAGNASQMSDGAAACLLMSREKADALGLKPLAVFRSFAVAGVEPEIMGIGPVYAIPKALQQAGLQLEQIDRFELNEAFAAQCLAVIRELELDPSKVNVCGGAIALGHPLGCTGAKLTATLIHELRRKGGGYGVVSMCIGGGMGAAGVIEVLSP